MVTKSNYMLLLLVQYLKLATIMFIFSVSFHFCNNFVWKIQISKLLYWKITLLSYWNCLQLISKPIECKGFNWSVLLKEIVMLILHITISSTESSSVADRSVDYCRFLSMLEEEVYGNNSPIWDPDFTHNHASMPISPPPASAGKSRLHTSLITLSIFICSIIVSHSS